VTEAEAVGAGFAGEVLPPAIFFGYCRHIFVLCGAAVMALMGWCPELGDWLTMRTFLQELSADAGGRTDAESL